jgi:hypothetical protein
MMDHRDYAKNAILVAVNVKVLLTRIVFNVMWERIGIMIKYSQPMDFVDAQMDLHSNSLYRIIVLLVIIHVNRVINLSIRIAVLLVIIIPMSFAQI